MTKTGTTICCVLLACCAVARSADPDGIEGVNALLDRIEKAHADRDAKTLADLCTDDALLTLIVTGSESGRKAHVLTKAKILPLFDPMWKTRDLKTRRKTDRDIVVGPTDLASMRVTTVDRFADGHTATYRDLYAAHKRGGTWRICFAMPEIFRMAPVAIAVAPGSVAERSGLKVSDAVTVCSGLKTDALSAAQKVTEMLTGKSERKTLALTVQRGRRELRVTIPADLGGATFQTRLLPLAPAVLVPHDKPHPVKELLKREVEILKTGRTEPYDEIFHPDGFFHFVLRPNQPTRLVGLADGKKLFCETIERARDMLDAPKTRLGPISVIANGDLAIATGQVTLTVKQTGKQVTVPSRMQVYARRGDKWFLAANMVQRIPFGTSVGVERPAGSGPGR